MAKFYDAIQKKETTLDVSGSFTKDKEVSLSETLYDEYRETAEPWRLQAKEDADFRNGAQWTSEEIKALKSKGQNPIVVNVIYPIVERAKALLTYNAPRFTATARENSDTKMAHVFADIMQYVWQVSHGNSELKDTTDDYYVKGMGGMLAYFDPYRDFGKGEVLLKSIDPFNIFIDPNSEDPFARDAAHILIVKKMTAEQILKMMPEAKDKLKNAQENSDDIRPTSQREGLEGQTDVYQNQYHSSYTVIDRYSKVKEGKYHAIEPISQYERIMDNKQYMQFLQRPVATESSAQGVKYIVEEREVAAYIDLYKKSGGTYYYMQDPQSGQPVMQFGAPKPGAIPNSEVVINILSMKDFIENGIVMVNRILVDRIKRVLSVGGSKFYEGVLPIEEYPIVPFMNEHKRNPYPEGDVRKVRGIQEYINKIRSLIIAHASNSTNVKLLMPRGSANKKEIEREWAKSGTAVIEYDPEIGTPIVAGPVPLPNELYKNEMDAKNDIQEILGVYSLSGGDPNQAQDSYRGTVALDEFAQRRIKAKRDDIEGAINQLALVIIQMVQAYWTEEKTIRIVNPNDNPKEMFLNQPLFDDYGKEISKINDITVGKYDVVVISGSTLPSNRYAKFDYFTKLYEMGLIDQVEVLKQTEVADMQGVLKRKNIMMQQQQQIQQLEQKIKDLTGDAQTKDREISHMQKKVELEKFKTDLHSAKSDIRKSTELYDARLQDRLAMSKKEDNGQNKG